MNKSNFFNIGKGKREKNMNFLYLQVGHNFSDFEHKKSQKIFLKQYENFHILQGLELYSPKAEFGPPGPFFLVSRVVMYIMQNLQFA